MRLLVTLLSLFIAVAAHAQEFTDIADGFVCMTFSNGSEMLVKRAGQGFKIVSQRESNQYIARRRKLITQRLERLRDARTAVKNGQLGKQVVSSMFQLIYDVFQERPSKDTRADYFEAFDRLEAHLRAEQKSILLVQQAIRNCQEERLKKGPGNGRVVGASLTLVTIPMLPQYAYRELHLGWLVTTATRRVGKNKKSTGFGGCLKVTYPEGVNRSYTGFSTRNGSIGPCDYLTPRYQLVDRQACRALLPAGLAGQVIPAYSWDGGILPGQQDLQDKVLQLNASKPQVDVLAFLTLSGLDKRERTCQVF